MGRVADDDTSYDDVTKARDDAESSRITLVRLRQYYVLGYCDGERLLRRWILLLIRNGDTYLVRSTQDCHEKHFSFADAYSVFGSILQPWRTILLY
jgi:hypothetical protein